LPKSVSELTIAGLVLAIATSCAGTEAGAQFRAYVGSSASGPGFGNAPAPGSAGLGTSGLGLGGFGSSTQGLVEPTPGNGSPGFGLPLQNQGSGSALGVTGNAGSAGGSGQGSLSSAIDRSSSPINSVTNSLMGPVSNAVSEGKKSATAGKKKQTGNAVAASSSDHGAATASKVSPAKSP
jgi:hypothetical protein